MKSIRWIKVNITRELILQEKVNANICNKTKNILGIDCVE